MRSVLILGQQGAASRIARLINDHAGDMHAVFVPASGYARLLAAPPSRELLLLRAGYRMGGATVRGRAFDAFWTVLRRRLRRAPAAFYWIGSDVFHTMEDARLGRLRWSAVRAVTRDLHLTVAPWLSDELGSIGINATTSVIPPAAPLSDDVAPVPDVFSVLTYLPARRFEFYGGATTLDVARRLPGIRFDVVANSGAAAEDAPPNVAWHGWVTDMPERYARCAVVLRIPRHDGFGRTVIEALLHARHAVYMQDVPHVRTVRPDDVDGIAGAIDAFRHEHESGTLRENLAGRAYIAETFDRAVVGRRLVALLEEAFQR